MSSYVRIEDHLSVHRTEHTEFKIFQKIDDKLNKDCHRLGCDFDRQQVIRELMIELNKVLNTESIFNTILDYEDVIDEDCDERYTQELMIELIQLDIEEYLHYLNSENERKDNV